MKPENAGSCASRRLKLHQITQDAYTRSALAFLAGGVGRSTWANLMQSGFVAAFATMAFCLIGEAASATWTVKRPVEGSAGQTGCYLQSEVMTVSDGYQDIQASIMVRQNAVLVQTGSPLDASFADIGLQVDNEALIHMDDVSLRQTALFTSHYTDLVEQFKKGLRVKAQLRFWPTWPVTGTHSVTFSLIGFTKAYADLQACTE
jgi:hypothetical protein